VKIALLFFLLITHRCGAPASWATQDTTMCLYPKDSLATFKSLKCWYTNADSLSSKFNELQHAKVNCGIYGTSILHYACNVKAVYGNREVNK